MTQEEQHKHKIFQTKEVHFKDGKKINNHINLNNPQKPTIPE